MPNPARPGKAYPQELHGMRFLPKGRGAGDANFHAQPSEAPTVPVKLLVQNADVAGTAEVTYALDIHVAPSLPLHRVADKISCDLGTRDFNLRPVHSPDDIGECVLEDFPMRDMFREDAGVFHFLVELVAGSTPRAPT